MGDVLFSTWDAWRTLGRCLAASVLIVTAVPGRVALAADDEQARASLAVVYPQIGEPYRSVFATIIEGIEERVRGKVSSFPVPTGAAPSGLPDEFKRRNVRAVIALGRSGMKAASGLDRQIPVIAGGVLSVPEAEAQGMLVHSLAPDPAMLFVCLKALVPAAKRVVVVYDPKQNDWLIRLARDAAKAHGLELVALDAADLKGAVRRYQETLGTMDARHDVLWLPQDSTTVEETTVVPMVLREFWSQNLVVFSSNVLHVRRGALFALYPDNAGIGRSLGAAALASLQQGGSPPSRSIQALQQVLTAVNTRTAEHLGIDLRTYKQPIHMVFPEY